VSNYRRADRKVDAIPPILLADTAIIGIPGWPLAKTIRHQPNGLRKVDIRDQQLLFLL
jgi:hypothetical protein